jgi:hypothetical protein
VGGPIIRTNCFSSARARKQDSRLGDNQPNLLFYPSQYLFSAFPRYVFDGSPGLQRTEGRSLLRPRRLQRECRHVELHQLYSHTRPATTRRRSSVALTSSLAGSRTRSVAVQEFHNILGDGTGGASITIRFRLLAAA